MFDSIGFNIDKENPASLVTPANKQYVVISTQITNMSETNKASLRLDMLGATSNIISTPIKKLPLAPEESSFVDTKMFVSNGKQLLFSTDSMEPISITVSYYTV